jgi:hypothetical protein
VTRRIAVVTDALSNGFFFPVWLKYYGDLFGIQNLFVVTYQGLSHHFQGLGLGALTELPHCYDDIRRADAISTHVSTLLERYDLVIRVDVDEILVPDLRKHAGLAAFLQNLATPYVTARGFDVVQLPQEPELDWDRPILIEQRAWAYPICSLNKTCATTIPLVWSAGFHGCTGYPLLGDLLLLHLKWVDAPRLINWHEYMSGQIGDDAFLGQYYNPEASRFLGHRVEAARRPIEGGWDALNRKAFNETYLKGMHLDRGRGIWNVTHDTEQVLLCLPEELKGLV